MGFTQAKTEWLNGKPNILWLRWLDDKNNIQCYHFSLGQELGILPTEWNDIEKIFADVSIHNLVDNALTDAQKKDCGTTKIPSTWLDKIANLPPPPAPAPTIIWKVAVNGTVVDRPIYDGIKYEACLTNAAITDKTQCNDSPNWVQIKARVTVGIPCEDKKIKPSTSKQEWHYVSNAAGARGLSICEVK